MKKPSNKQIKIAAVVAVVLAAGIITYNVLQNKKRLTQGAIDDPTGNGTVDPGSLAFNATSVANELHEIMRDTWSEEQEIFDLLSPISSSQFGQVFQKFGKRTYNPELGNDWDPFGLLDKHDLKKWLSSELKTQSYSTLRKKYPNHL